uniref:Uncharacterized protein n=1 Tax=Timema bartmani TaxID=61472 RepID=A0A7R9F276_9NEOP|nr:unnamed protein product [Timema bartmani]
MVKLQFDQRVVLSAVADLLAVSATNERTSLVVRYLNPNTETPRHEVSLTHLLTEHIKFDTHSDLDCLFNTGQVMSGLAGILVKIVPVFDVEYRMEVYTREMSQVYLLVSRLYSLIPVNTLAVLPWVPTAPPNPRKLYKALLAEVRLMESLAPTDDTDMDYTGDIPVLEDKLTEVRQRLAALELETDLLAARL